MRAARAFPVLMAEVKCVDGVSGTWNVVSKRKHRLEKHRISRVVWHKTTTRGRNYKGHQQY